MLMWVIALCAALVLAPAAGATAAPPPGGGGPMGAEHRDIARGTGEHGGDGHGTEGPWRAAHQLLLNAMLVIVTLLALEWREARWARRAARQERPRLRSMRRRARVLSRDDASHETVVSVYRRAS
jgi:hypothetical protein